MTHALGKELSICCIVGNICGFCFSGFCFYSIPGCQDGQLCQMSDTVQPPVCNVCNSFHNFQAGSLPHLVRIIYFLCDAKLASSLMRDLSTVLLGACICTQFRSLTGSQSFKSRAASTPYRVLVAHVQK